MAKDEIAAKLDQIGMRQEAMIQSMDMMVATLGNLLDRVTELQEWAQTPPSRDLADALRDLFKKVDLLPEEVAEAVRKAVA